MECYELPSVATSRKGRYSRQPQRQDRSKQQKPDNAFGLSVREMAVLYLLTEGLTDKEIAVALGVTAYTVNKHVGAILAKMQVRSRTAAAVRAIREHVFPAESFEFIDHVPLGQEEPPPRWSR